MENKKKNFFFCQIGIFLLNWEKNILIGIGNGAEFRPQNRVIESPEQICTSFNNKASVFEIT